MANYFRPVFKQNPRKEILYFLPDNFIILRNEVYQYDTSEVYYVGQLEGLNDILEYDFITGSGIALEKVKESLFYPYNYRLDFEISSVNYLQFICNLNTDSMPQVEEYFTSSDIPTSQPDLTYQRDFHYAKFFFTEFQYQHALKYHMKAIKEISKNILKYNIIPENFSFNRHIFKNLTKPFSLFIFGLRSSLCFAINYNILGAIINAYNPIIEIDLEILEQKKIYDKIQYTPGQLGQIYYDKKSFLFQSLSDYPILVYYSGNQRNLIERYLNFNAYSNFIQLFTEFIVFEYISNINNSYTYFVEFPWKLDEIIITDLAKFQENKGNKSFESFKEFFFTIPNTLGGYKNVYYVLTDFWSPISFKIPISNNVSTYQINFGSYNNPIVNRYDSYIQSDSGAAKQNIGIYNIDRNIGSLYSIEPLRDQNSSSSIYISPYRAKSQLYPLGFVGQTSLVDNDGNLQFLLFECGVGAHEYSSGLKNGFIGGHTIQKYNSSDNSLNLINRFLPSASSPPFQRVYPAVQSYMSSVDTFEYLNPIQTDWGIKQIDSTSSIIFMVYNQGWTTSSNISNQADKNASYNNGVLFFKQTPFSTTETAQFLERISFPLESMSGKGKFYFIKDFDNTSIIELEALNTLQKLQEITPNSYYYDTTNNKQVLEYSKQELASILSQNSKAFPFMYFIDKVNKPQLITLTRDNIYEAYIYRLDDNTNAIQSYTTASGTITIDIYPASSPSDLAKTIFIEYGTLGITNIKENDYKQLNLSVLPKDANGFIDLQAKITKPSGIGVNIVLYTTKIPTSGNVNSYQTTINSNILTLDKNTTYDNQVFNIKFDPNEALRFAIFLT